MSSPARRRVPAGAWVDVASGSVRGDALAILSQRAVVLLGEEHDQAEHHRWQLHTIAALHGRRSELIVGFEMFPRRVQPVLDRWSAGELGEAEFLAAVDWQQVWGMDAALYLPLFHFARMHRLPMAALNVDRATARAAAAQGFAAVPPGEREGVGDPAPARAAYRARLAEVFKMHPRMSDAADDERFERFVRGQLFWDRAMADAIAAARRARPQALVVGILGRGHLEYGDGVPHQLAALAVTGVASALPWHADSDYPTGVADFLFGIAPHA
jgi:uncharacterized iron-regulated protein